MIIMSASHDLDDSVKLSEEHVIDFMFRYLSFRDRIIVRMNGG